MDWTPPSQMTRTMPILMKIVRAGVIDDMNCMTLTVRSRQVFVCLVEAFRLVVGADK